MNYRFLVSFAAWGLITSFAVANEERTIRALVTAGATVERDESQPEKPVIVVKYNLRDVSDRGIKALAELEKLPAIEFIGSGDTEITVSTLRALQGKSSLKRFAISNAKVSDESAKALGALQSLNILSLKSQIECSPHAVEEIFELKHLKELTLSDRLVNDHVLNQVSKLPDLKVLNVRSVFVTDQGLDSLSQLTGLKTLRIFLGPDVTRVGLRHLGAIHLTQLEITYFNVSDVEIKELSKLSSITALRLLNVKKMTEAVLPDLAEMKGLKELEIVGGNLTKANVTSLKKKLPGCIVIEGIQ